MADAQPNSRPPPMKDFAKTHDDSYAVYAGDEARTDQLARKERPPSSRLVSSAGSTPTALRPSATAPRAKALASVVESPRTSLRSPRPLPETNGVKRSEVCASPREAPQQGRGDVGPLRTASSV